MDKQVQELSRTVFDQYATLDDQSRLIIAIAGIPGSGKTTLANAIVKAINQLHLENHCTKLNDFNNTISPPAVYVPLDGFHLTRQQLSEMPNPKEAFARRGSVFTFDGNAFASLVRSLRQPVLQTSPIIYAPSFDHSVKDPVPDNISIQPINRIIVMEGNYLALNFAPWSDLVKLYDQLWFLDVNEEIAKKRLIARHLHAGIVETLAEAEERVKNNDLVNACEILENRISTNLIITPISDEHWANS